MPSHLYYDRACVLNSYMEHIMEQELQLAVPDAFRKSRPKFVYDLDAVARVIL